MENLGIKLHVKDKKLFVSLIEYTDQGDVILSEDSISFQKLKENIFLKSGGLEIKEGIDLLQPIYEQT